MRTIRIEKRRFDAEGAAAKLRAALARHRVNPITPAEASVLSGVPLHSCEAGLLILAARNPSTITVDDDGTLRVSFHSLATPLTRWEHAKSRFIRWNYVFWSRFAQWATLNLLIAFILAFFSNIAALGEFGPDGYLSDFIYIVGIVPACVAMIILVVTVAPLYLVGWAVVHLIESSEINDLPILVLEAVISGLVIATATFLYVHFANGILRGRDPFKALLAFFIGDRGPSRDSLADERRLTATIFAKGGVICSADLLSLFEWTPAEADAELVKILLAYGGDVHVTETGGIAYVFDKIGRSSETSSLKVESDRAPETAPTFVAASRRFTLGLAVMVVISLLLLAVGPIGRSLPMLEDYLAAYARHQSLLELLFEPGVGLWPILGLALWLGVRFVVWRRELRAYHAGERRRRLIRGIITNPSAVRVKQGAYSTRELALWGATYEPGDPREDGTAQLGFPAIASGLAAAAELRGQREPEDG